MKRNFGKVFFILAALLLLSCGSNKKAMHTVVETIRFGNGGGITGYITTYVLSSDGKITQTNESMTRQGMILLKTLDKKITDQFYSKAKELKDYSYSAPDNMFLFLEIQTSEKNNKIVWGADKSSVDPRVISLYNELMEVLK